MWRLQCAQSREQEDTIACLQREIEHLKGSFARSESPHAFELDPLGPDTGGTTSHASATSRPAGQFCCPSAIHLPSLAISSWRTTDLFTTSSGSAAQLCDHASYTYIMISGHISPVPATCIPGLVHKGKPPHLTPSQERTLRSVLTT